MIHHRSKERIASLGEVFTPSDIVNKILRTFPEVIWKKESAVWLEQSCGNGNFVVAIINKRLDSGLSIESAINTVFAMDIKQDNVDDCHSRVLDIIGNRLADGYNADYIARLVSIVRHNICVVDSLKYTKSDWENKKFLFIDPTGSNQVESGTYQKDMVRKSKKWLLTLRNKKQEMRKFHVTRKRY